MQGLDLTFAYVAHKIKTTFRGVWKPLTYDHRRILKQPINNYENATYSPRNSFHILIHPATNIPSLSSPVWGRSCHVTTTNPGISVPF